ncbi:MAG: hypothetical protein MK212_10135 [Saprospiraceae bacterium]|nr:hypothetical protein [Saprospiraceae bacterium]
MRIIGYLEDLGQVKITVFKSDLRFIVKFEDGFFEQSYKFLASDQLNGLNAVRELIDDTFKKQVLTQFEQMRSNVSELWERQLPIATEEEWEEII